MITHEDVFVLDVFQHQQLQKEVSSEASQSETNPWPSGVSIQGLRENEQRHTHHFLELGLNLLRRELLAQRRLPEQHVTVVGQQLRTFGLWLSFQTHPANTAHVNGPSV